MNYIVTCFYDDEHHPEPATDLPTAKAAAEAHLDALVSSGYTIRRLQVIFDHPDTQEIRFVSMEQE